MVIYPAPSLHHVQPINGGVRPAAIFWIQRLVRTMTIGKSFSISTSRSGASERTPERLMPEKRTRSADQRQQYQPKDE
jgi:hypothetical protein